MEWVFWLSHRGVLEDITVCKVRHDSVPLNACKQLLTGVQIRLYQNDAPVLVFQILVFLVLFLIDVQHFNQMGVVLEFFEGAVCLHLAILHNDDTVCEMQEVNSMGHKHPGAVLEKTLKHFLEDKFPDVGIERRDGIVHEDNVVLRVDGPRETNSSFLPARQIYALFSDLCHISCWQNSEV